MDEIRIGLTIAGAVSLGAYEGGALAALVLAVQELGKGSKAPVRIDAIGGASAGSITGMLTARCLLDGLDPIHVMSEAWVRQDSLAAMMTNDKHAPLSIEALRRAALTLLDPPTRYRGRPQQDSPIVIHMALGCLRGLNFLVGRLEGPPIEASTFLDWGEFTLQPNMSIRDYTDPDAASVVDFALASGANTFGFPPQVLNRTTRPEDLALMGRGDITNLPPEWSGFLWYTDGGTIDNEPLGRTFDIANSIDVDGGGRRIHLLIHPHPQKGSAEPEWTLPGDRPAWTATVLRCDTLQRTRGIYDDLRRAEKTNSRLIWTEHFRNAVTPLLEEHDEAWRATLSQVLESFREQKAAIERKEPDAIQPSDEARQAAAPVPEDLDAVELFRRVLAQASGLSGKHPARIEVVSPLLLPEAATTSMEELLAGEFLLHFGGFLNERLRWSDFALGYRSMQKWLERLEEFGVDPANAESARRAVSERYESAWATGWGAQTLRSLPWRDRLQVGRLALHMARVVIGEVVFRRRRR
jgi:hypothetical protein